MADRPGAATLHIGTQRTLIGAIDPTRDAGSEVSRLIARYASDGLDGVEVFYPTHTREQTALLYDCCSGGDLLATGSSDFHGPDHKLFSRFLAFDLHGLEPRLGPVAA